MTALLLLCGTVAADGDGDAGKTKSASCAACHGADGNSQNPQWPSLAGQHAKYSVIQLQAFKDGNRQNAMMTPMAAPLSDQDMQDIAAFYATQSMSAKQADPDKVRLGQAIYRGGNMEEQAAACIACHGPSGSGNPPAGYPAISGQHAAYVVAQLKAYKAGTRRSDASQMMRNVASELSDDEIDAVASYVQGLQ
jgi:cytochrome c553